MTDRLPEFSDLPLDPALLQGLDALGHVQMTPIQAQSLPALLEGRDLIAQAPTGSGKTAAFGLALLHRLDPTQIKLQALVLCPTRELADQVSKHLRKLATGIANLKLLTLTGGVSYTGKVPWDAANTLYVDPVTLYDAGLRYQRPIGGKDTTWRLTVANLTDEDYWTTRSGILYLGSPRTLSLSVSLAF